MAGNSASTVVLVHGGFVDGAGWEGVYKLLKKDGYDVSIVQNPTLNLAGDVAATRQVIAQAKGPWCWWAIPTAAWSSPRQVTTRR
jgi:hypothetical protein